MRSDEELDAEFPLEGARLEISTLRFLLATRTTERDRARSIAVSLENELAEQAHKREIRVRDRSIPWDHRSRLRGGLA
jgi:hypothetical protein